VRSLNPAIPIRLDALITALLEKEPERRTVQASQVEAELRAIERALANNETNLLAERPSWIPEPRVEKPTAIERPRRHSRRPYAIAAGLALAIVATIIAFAIHSSSTDTRPSPDVSASTASARTVHPCSKQGGDACKLACEANDALACRVHGRELYVEAKKDDEKQHAAIDVLSKGCTLGDASSCTLAGTWVHRHATHGDQRYTRDAWVTLFERGCELDPGSACALLAEHLNSESPANRTRALQLYERSCTTNPASCAHAADMLQHGDAAEQARAKELAATACSRGYTRACN
jgi:hypothetical protein